MGTVAPIDWTEPNAAKVLAEVAAERPLGRAASHRHEASRRLRGKQPFVRALKPRDKRRVPEPEQSAADEMIDYWISQY